MSQEPVHLLVVSGWSEKNRGDAGILEGMVASIRAAYPRAILSLWLDFEEDDNAFRDFAASRLAPMFGGGVYPSPLPCTLKPGRSITQVWRLARSVAIACLARLGLAGRVRFLLSGSERRAFETMLRATAVVSKGGQFIMSSGRARSSLYLYRMLYPLILAQCVGRPTMVWGQSIGPLKGRIAWWLARRVLGRVSVIAVREEISARLLEDTGIGGRVTVTADAAFLLEPDEEASASGVQVINQAVAEATGRGKALIGIAARSWDFSSPARGRAYVDSLAALADFAATELGAVVLLIPFVIGPTESEDDRRVVRAVHERAGNKERVIPCWASERLSAPAMKAMCGRLDAMVAVRTHAMVFAASQGVPTLAVSYLGSKTHGIADMLGISDCVLDIEDVDADKLQRMLVQVWARREELRTHLCGVARVLRRRALDTADLLGEVVAGAGVPP